MMMRCAEKYSIISIGKCENPVMSMKLNQHHKQATLTKCK